jgi:hypothetical protein
MFLRVQLQFDDPIEQRGQRCARSFQMDQRFVLRFSLQTLAAELRQHAFRFAPVLLLTTVNSPTSRSRIASVAGAIAWSSARTSSSSLCR